MKKYNGETLEIIRAALGMSVMFRASHLKPKFKSTEGWIAFILSILSQEGLLERGQVGRFSIYRSRGTIDEDRMKLLVDDIVAKKVGQSAMSLRRAAPEPAPSSAFEWVTPELEKIIDAIKAHGPVRVYGQLNICGMNIDLDCVLEPGKMRPRVVEKAYGPGPCPECGADTEWRKGSSSMGGSFWGCSMYAITGCKGKRFKPSDEMKDSLG